LAKLRSGELSPTKAIMFGKLKVSNPMEIWEYAKIFGLM
jgi:putative sterol carrier protein